jgi:nicotinate-nucleotide pyrophosphorylase (carboxylating)
MASPPLPPVLYEPVVRAALAEDLGRGGDITSDAVLPADLVVAGQLVAREDGCIAGLPVAVATFGLLDPSVQADLHVTDGDVVEAGTVLADITGAARSLLAAERTALNFLGHLSGIATITRRIVESVAGSGVRVACTRKTTPGLRALEKHAVRAGGGSNHRLGLDDAVLIKDNHRIAAGGIAVAVRRAREAVGHLVKVEVEVDTLDELDEALAAGADAILLDNMAPEALREAVERVGDRAITEASGAITPERAPVIAATGVDVMSIGWLTHSAPRLDVAFDVSPPRG